MKLQYEVCSAVSLSVSQCSKPTFFGVGDHVAVHDLPTLSCAWSGSLCCLAARQSIRM